MDLEVHTENGLLVSITCDRRGLIKIVSGEEFFAAVVKLTHAMRGGGA